MKSPDKRANGIAPLICAVALCIAGCTASAGGGNYPDPIPGSITYGGQPRTKLTKSPIGSVVHNDFYDQQGQHVYETYILQPDRSLKLVRRQIVPDFP